MSVRNPEQRILNSSTAPWPDRSLAARRAGPAAWRCGRAAAETLDAGHMWPSLGRRGHSPACCMATSSTTARIPSAIGSQTATRPPTAGGTRRPTARRWWLETLRTRPALPAGGRQRFISQREGLHFALASSASRRRRIPAGLLYNGDGQLHTSTSTPTSYSAGDDPTSTSAARPGWRPKILPMVPAQGGHGRRAGWGRRIAPSCSTPKGSDLLSPDLPN